jgi:hypothetical protein
MGSSLMEKSEAAVKYKFPHDLAESVGVLLENDYEILWQFIKVPCEEKLSNNNPLKKVEYYTINKAHVRRFNSA